MNLAQSQFSASQHQERRELNRTWCNKSSGPMPETNDRYAWTDIGNGNLFADWYENKARYVPERKRWYIYNGRVWEPDSGNLKAMELCKDLADALAVYALSI